MYIKTIFGFSVTPLRKATMKKRKNSTVMLIVALDSYKQMNIYIHIYNLDVYLFKEKLNYNFLHENE